MNLFKVGIGSKFDSKPDKYAIAIAKETAQRNYKDLCISTIADMVGNKGYSLIPHVLEGGLSKDCFRKAQLFLLDFDGAKWDDKKQSYIGKNISFEQIKQRADKYYLPIAFAYKTLSCPDGDEYYKFRVGFVFEQPIGDIVVAEFIHKALGRIFDGCDFSCCEASRMFLGGKELIYLNPDARIDLVQITHSLYKVYEEGGHLNRLGDWVKKKTDIEYFDKKKLMAIGYEKDISIFGEKIDSAAVTILTAQSGFSPIFYIKRNNKNRSCLHQKKTSQSNSKIKLDNHLGVCPLLKDYVNSSAELSHMERFILATNLNQISKGLDLFYEILNKDYPDSVSKWERDKSTIRRYSPKSCCEECRYFEECQKKSSYPNIITKLNNDRNIIDNTHQTYVTLEEAEKNVCDNLKFAYESRCEGIHLIKAQTAVGKTYQIKKLIKANPGRRFLIAEPHNKLKREVYESIKEVSSAITVTPSVRECMFITEEKRQEYMNLHQSGKHRDAKGVVKECLDEYKKNSPEAEAAIKELEFILSGISACDEIDVVVTTHAMLVNMREEQLRKFDCIIIDEDILYLQLLSNIKKISKARLIELSENSSKEYSNIARTMLCAQEGRYYKASWYYPFLGELVDKDDRDNDDWYENYDDSSQSDSFFRDDNINDLSIAGSYVLEDGIYYYFCAQKLPKLKYIVLTATSNIEVYRRYVGDDMPIYEYPYMLAKYKGKLKQYTYHSLGRGDLEKKQYIYDYKNKYIGESTDIISFKKEEANHVLNSKNIHFGNAVGINDFKGKDLVIFGTPFKNPKAYFLPCSYLYGGQEVNTETRLYNRRLDYKDKNFGLSSFKSDILNNFLMYSLESELEQCIGRSRLLRCDCTVYLFSAFPCEQAEYITEDYLKEYVEKKDQALKA